MIRLIGLAVSIGLADSLNPSTIVPALYLATGERPRERVFEFTVGVFGVYFIGGAAIALGPGQLLLSLVPHPSHTTRYVIEVVVGATILIAGALLWIHRGRLEHREPPDISASGKGTWLLGATITIVELPTAFPYFAVLAAIVGSGLGPARQLTLLLIFNVCFVLPLLGIVAVLTFGGGRTDRLLAAGRDFLQRRWPVLLSVLAVVAGLVVIALGITGLTNTRQHVKHITHELTENVTP
ncbi:MAG: GAP family protein [Solirubrobacteraceae bacterium]